MTDIMLDLETWGTRPGCDLRSIGAVVFDPLIGVALDFRDGTTERTAPNTGKSFYINCDNPIESAIEPVMYRYPLVREPGTVEFWNKSENAAAEAQLGPNRVDLRDALAQLGIWIASIETDMEAVRIWSHGPSFDISILAAAYEACGLPVPWHYRAPRDTRTIMEAAGMDPHKGLEPFSTGTHHNALDDAICQARAVCEAYRRLAVPHDVVMHRSEWRRALEAIPNMVIEDNSRNYWRHELNIFDRTFETLANHPCLEIYTYSDMVNPLRNMVANPAIKIEPKPKPIPMILHCPKCHTQHIDKANAEWSNPPHRSHSCQAPGCGTIWRPADVATVGVRSIATKGKSDNWKG